MKTEENKRMLALSYIVADLKAENIELADRVQYLEEDYNKVVSLLHVMEKRKDEDPAKLLLGNMQKMRDHCDKLEKDNEQLKRQCVQLQTERNEAKTHADECELQKEELFKHIDRFNTSEFLEIGDDCIHRDSLSFGSPVKVGSGVCMCCRHLIKVDVHGRKCVLCAWCYDNTKSDEAQECKTTDD